MRQCQGVKWLGITEPDITDPGNVSDIRIDDRDPAWRVDVCLIYFRTGEQEEQQQRQIPFNFHSRQSLKGKIVGQGR